MANEFYLSDSSWAAIEPLLPKNRPGARRVDGRRAISGIVHVLQSGCRGKDCPSLYGPPTTIYNRFNRRPMAEKGGENSGHRGSRGGPATKACPLT